MDSRKDRTDIVEVLEWTQLPPDQAKDIAKWGLGRGASETAYRPDGTLDAAKVLSNLQQRLERLKVAVGAAKPRPKG